MSDSPQDTARPASVADLKLLLGALQLHGVDYLLIGGYALYALGYQRGTVDIDILLRPTLEQGEKVKQALMLLPEGVASPDKTAKNSTATKTRSSGSPAFRARVNPPSLRGVCQHAAGGV